jgi:hypothetical protein
MRNRVTPFSYAAELLAISWRHGRELAMTLGSAVTISVIVFWIGFAFDSSGGVTSRRVIVVLVLATVTTICCQALLAGWRLHRRLSVVLETTRALLDSRSSECTDLEQRLLHRYRRREERINQRNDARLERLDGEISALEARVTSGAAT